MSISPKNPYSPGYADGAASVRMVAESVRNAQRSAAGTTGAADAEKTGAGAPTMSGPSAEMLRQLMDELPAGGTVRSKANDGDRVVNRRNAPALYAPEGDASGIDRMERMLLLTVLNQDGHMKVVKDGLESDGVKLEKNTALRTKKQEEINAKEADASLDEKTAKVWGWVGKIAAVIGAVAAVIVTGVAALASGGAGTVLLALSVMALINAAMSLADEVSKANGGPEISVTNLINHTVVPVFETLGMEHDTAQKIAIGLAAVPLFVVEPQMLGATVEEICKSAGVSEDTAKICGQVAVAVAAVVVAVAMMGTSLPATGISALSSIAGTAYRLVQGSAQLTKAVASGFQGVYKVTAAITNRDVGYIQADRADLAAGATMLRKQMDANQEFLKTLLQYVQNAVRAAAQMIKDLYDSLSQITRNIGQPSPV